MENLSSLKKEYKNFTDNLRCSSKTGNMDLLNCWVYAKKVPTLAPMEFQSITYDPRMLRHLPLDEVCTS